MAAIRRPDDPRLLPYGRSHGRRHDGIVAGGQGENGTLKVCFSALSVPMHQPIEPLIEPCDVQHLGQSEARSATRPPKRLHGATWIAGQPALERSHAARRHMGAEAVEALNADQRLEAAAPVLQQPQQAERVADGNGVLRPVVLTFGPSGDEAEVDHGHLSVSEMADDIGPCLLYTSDAADEEDSVDLGGRRIIKKKKNKEQ